MSHVSTLDHEVSHYIIRFCIVSHCLFQSHIVSSISMSHHIICFYIAL
jgi:hypothetical protein